MEEAIKTCTLYSCICIKLETTQTSYVDLNTDAGTMMCLFFKKLSSCTFMH